jgi:hypothetical protein
VVALVPSYPGRLVVFGGTSNTSEFLDDAWLLTVSAPSVQRPSYLNWPICDWKQLENRGDRPPATMGAGHVALRNSTLRVGPDAAAHLALFGGCVGEGLLPPRCPRASHDLYLGHLDASLTFIVWQKVAETGHSAVLPEVAFSQLAMRGETLFVVGGYLPNSTYGERLQHSPYLPRLWEGSFHTDPSGKIQVTWQEYSTPAFFGTNALAYNPTKDELLVLGVPANAGVLVGPAAVPADAL